MCILYTYIHTVPFKSFFFFLFVFLMVCVCVCERESVPNVPTRIVKPEIFDIVGMACGPHEEKKKEKKKIVNYVYLKM